MQGHNLPWMSSNKNAKLAELTGQWQPYIEVMPMCADVSYTLYAKSSISIEEMMHNLDML